MGIIVASQSKSVHAFVETWCDTLMLSISGGNENNARLADMSQENEEDHSSSSSPLTTVQPNKFSSFIKKGGVSIVMN